MKRPRENPIADLACQLGAIGLALAALAASGSWLAATIAAVPLTLLGWWFGSMWRDRRSQFWKEIDRQDKENGHR